MPYIYLEKTYYHLSITFTCLWNASMNFHSWLFFISSCLLQSWYPWCCFFDKVIIVVKIWFPFPHSQQFMFWVKSRHKHLYWMCRMTEKVNGFDALLDWIWIVHLSEWVRTSNESPSQGAVHFCLSVFLLYGFICFKFLN